MRDLAAQDDVTANNLLRYLVAEKLRDQGLPDDAVTLIEPIADLQHLSPATRLYLGCLSIACRDDTLRKALASRMHSMDDGFNDSSLILDDRVLNDAHYFIC